MAETKGGTTMLKWKDSSSYSQRETERIPRTWSAKVGAHNVIVTRIVHFPDTWYLHIRSLGIDTREIKSKDISNAKREAELILKMELRQRVDEIEKAIKEIEQGE